MISYYYGFSLKIYLCETLFLACIPRIIGTKEEIVNNTQPMNSNDVAPNVVHAETAKELNTIKTHNQIGISPALLQSEEQYILNSAFFQSVPSVEPQ